MPSDEGGEMEIIMHHKRGLRLKISIYILIIMFILGTTLVMLSYINMYNSSMEMYQVRAENLVQIAANMVDGDKIKNYNTIDDIDEYYVEMWVDFNNLKEHTDDIAYLYIFKPYDDHFTYILDIYAEDDDFDNISAFGSEYYYTEDDYEDLVPDIKAKKASDKLIYGEDVGYGETISAWAPVLDSEGNLVAMVEADLLTSTLSKEIRNSLIKTMLGLLEALVLLLVAMVIIINRKVTLPLEKLTDYVSSFEEGSFKKQKFMYKGNDEIKWLSDSFFAMIDKMDKYQTDLIELTKEKERIGTELDVATHIQSSMLPCIFPKFTGKEEFDIYATMNPAKEVGGDFYDFFMVDETHLAIVMADVSGKGVPAALFMVIGKTLIKDHTQPDKALGDVFSIVNNLLCDSNSEEMFITAFEGVIDLVTGDFHYVNAGHEIPYICKKGSTYEPYKVPAGFVLAGMEGMKYREGNIVLEEGDKIFLYTDGVPEATNNKNELYGAKRLTKILGQNSEKNPKELLEAVKSDVDAFVGEAAQFDDLTMLCLDFKKKMSV